MNLSNCVLGYAVHKMTLDSSVLMPTIAEGTLCIVDLRMPRFEIEFFCLSRLSRAGTLARAYQQPLAVVFEAAARLISMQDHHHDVGSS